MYVGIIPTPFLPFLILPRYPILFPSRPSVCSGKKMRFFLPYKNNRQECSLQLSIYSVCAPDHDRYLLLVSLPHRLFYSYFLPQYKKMCIEFAPSYSPFATFSGKKTLNTARQRSHQTEGCCPRIVFSLYESLGTLKYVFL